MNWLTLPAPTPEYRFHTTRKWRFDYAWPDKKIAIEVEGGVWTGGRHTRGAGFVADCEKYNTAAAMGWLVFRFTPQQMRKFEFMKYVEFFFLPKKAPL
jgi:hypothetical protein